MCNVCGVRILDHGSIDLIVEAMPKMDSFNPHVNLDRETARRLAEDSPAALVLEFLSYHGSNRGPDSGGFATYDGNFHLHREIGKPRDVMHYDDPEKRAAVVAGLRGDVGIAHRRYTTTGIVSEPNIQPFEPVGNVVIAHNGNLVNDKLIKDSSPWLFSSTSDSEVIQHFLAMHVYDRNSFGANVQESMKKILGAYTVTALAEDRLFAFKDGNGYWPLNMADLNGIIVINSEITPIMKLAAAMGIESPEIREIENGNIMVVDESFSFNSSPVKIFHGRETKHIFDFIYMRHQDDPEATRYRTEAGKLHAELERKIDDAYVVSYAPSSGRHYAAGFAQASGLNVAELISKDKSFDARIFLLPTEKERVAALKKKYSFRQSYQGEKAFLFDDSIVRDTTMSYLVGELGRKKIEELHIRIGSAPIITPDHLGIHMPTREELIAHNLKSVRHIERYFEAIFYGFDRFGQGNREWLIKETNMLDDSYTIERLIANSVRAGKNVQRPLRKINERDAGILREIGYRKGRFSLRYLSGTREDPLHLQKTALKNAGIDPERIHYGPMMPGWSGYPVAMRPYLPKLAA